MSDIEIRPYQLVHIYMDSCAGCLPMNQNVLQMEQKRIDLASFTCEAREYESLISKYAIEELPCTLLLKNEKLLGRVKGYQPIEILSIWVDSLIDDCVDYNQFS